MRGNTPECVMTNNQRGVGKQLREFYGKKRLGARYHQARAQLRKH
jgi:hypothetical protein